MEPLYSLRQNFAIIGITGRSGSGCSEIANKLSDPNYISKIKSEFFITEETTDTNDLKFNICLDFLDYKNNWRFFKTIKYTHVLFYQLLYEAFYADKTKEDAANFLMSVVFPDKTFETPRFSKKDNEFQNIKILIEEITNKTEELFKSYSCTTLEMCLDDEDKNTYNDFFNVISPLGIHFFDSLRTYNHTKTNLFIQDIACHLRSTGSVSYTSCETKSLKHIYIIAETINRLIKCFRQEEKHGRIVIDSLKNSLELTFFKERYAAFYCLATNKLEVERIDYKLDRISQFDPAKSKFHSEENLKIDSSEYKGSEVNRGSFSSPDIENCIQKSEYHIFYSKSFNKYKNQLIGETNRSVNLDIQLVKFIALLFNPGIITPTAQERSMQIAFNAKANSGCISRQVGAVVTDIHHSVKAIGWNDVAKNQIPCNLRSLKDLVSNRNNSHFSDFEKGISGAYKDKESFIQKIKNTIKLEDIDNKLEGKNCSFCFKTCHNTFEGESNQVHTRSLHAEENAMLQITKHGGQGINQGYLYTTASPCELCSKKAFQLGIKTIYFIDPYPGIATSHILKSASSEGNNPQLIMFRGAVGRGFHKLYEPFMAYKDELNIRANLHPKDTNEKMIERLTSNKDKQKLIKEILDKK